MQTEWPELVDEICQCRRCTLCVGRSNVVPGEGDLQARLLLIGEGPGYHEDLQGRPFVGAAGQLLDKMLAAIHLTRQQVFIANIVKCRPPNNRDPQEDEIQACLPWLRRQFQIIRPDFILCLGRISAQAIISRDIRITQDHGRFYERKGIQFMPTFHPAALLRNQALKRDAWADLQILQHALAGEENH